MLISVLRIYSLLSFFFFFFFNDTATTEIYTLSLHDALPITVTVGADQAGSRMTGRVVRAFADPGGLSYQVQPDDPIEPPVRASAADIDPVAGTAWPSIGHLTAARAKAGVPLQPGEVLTAGSHCAWVIAGPARSEEHTSELQSR